MQSQRVVKALPTNTNTSAWVKVEESVFIVRVALAALSPSNKRTLQ
jgi:hypothetical protein